MGCPNGQDIVVVGTFDRQTWRRVTGAQPNCFRKEGAMLSTTVEPECRQRPFVMSYVMTEPRSEAVAADGAPAREATKVLAHATIHPAADRVEAYDATARAISPAVH
jgi:3-hydroxyisobutyrate dehydrogenase-like beta-hydroxyacid dehydrogenase